MMAVCPKEACPDRPFSDAGYQVRLIAGKAGIVRDQARPRVYAQVFGQTDRGVPPAGATCDTWMCLPGRVG